MYSVLLVDDEKYAVKGLAAGVEWEELGFEEVYEAYDVAQAKEVAGRSPVDLAVLDIEMPGGSGLQLAEWLNENSPQTELIFLTGHANFTYAKQAMEVGAFRYLLKPVDHEELAEIIRQAVAKLEAEREMLDYRNTYRKYYALWESQKPLLVDRFWQDVVAGRLSVQPSRLEPMLRQYDIPLSPEGRVLPILISIERWELEFGSRDEEIMEYAVRKAAEELVLAGHPGVVVGERRSSGLILAYYPDCGVPSGGQEEAHRFAERCRSFLDSCKEYFHCRLSCYVGMPVPIAEVSEAYHRLLGAERGNVTSVNSVMVPSEPEPPEDGFPPPPPVGDWAPLLDGESKDSMLQRVERYFRRLEGGRAAPEVLVSFYFAFSHMMLEAARRKGLPQPEVLSVWEQVAGAPPVKAAAALRTWAARLIDRHWSEAGSGEAAYSSVIVKVMEHIRAHPGEELGREQLAATVYLNPAYLSRMFRKETGISLTEYIQDVKLERAKLLLAESNHKVGSVAEAVGYTHFSYFAKIFKKATGLSPHEYRKRYRKLP